jgi:hypothetical protein
MTSNYFLIKYMKCSKTNFMLWLFVIDKNAWCLICLCPCRCNLSRNTWENFNEAIKFSLVWPCRLLQNSLLTSFSWSRLGEYMLSKVVLIVSEHYWTPMFSLRTLTQIASHSSQWSLTRVANFFYTTALSEIKGVCTWYVYIRTYVKVEGIQLMTEVNFYNRANLSEFLNNNPNNSMP